MTLALYSLLTCGCQSVYRTGRLESTLHGDHRPEDFCAVEGEIQRQQASDGAAHDGRSDRRGCRSGELAWLADARRVLYPWRAQELDGAHDRGIVLGEGQRISGEFQPALERGAEVVQAAARKRGEHLVPERGGGRECHDAAALAWTPAPVLREIRLVSRTTRAEQGCRPRRSFASRARRATIVLRAERDPTIVSPNEEEDPRAKGIDIIRKLGIGGGAPLPEGLAAMTVEHLFGDV